MTKSQNHILMFYLFRVDDEVDNITIDRGYDVDVLSLSGM
jgi:hypothetical protein